MVLNLEKSTLQPIKLRGVSPTDVKLFVKRDDLVDPLLGGNKFRKLKYNLSAFAHSGKRGILTFGGPWSNHIAAVAKVGEQLGVPTIGIVRGYDTPNPSQTILNAQHCGMQIFFRGKQQFEELKTDVAAGRPVDLPDDMYILPEGGANLAGAKGCAEILAEIPIDFDIIACPCGSGTTLAGLAAALKRGQEAWGFPVMKNGEYLGHEIASLQTALGGKEGGWRLKTDYHFGGYAKFNEELLEFIKDFYRSNQIMLDPVYSAKMFFGVAKELQMGRDYQGKTLVLLHTGGMQGLAGIEEKLGYSLYPKI